MAHKNGCIYFFFFCSEEVRQSGFCIILDTRASNWHTSKHILRTLQVGWGGVGSGSGRG